AIAAALHEVRRLLYAHDAQIRKNWPMPEVEGIADQSNVDQARMTEDSIQDRSRRGSSSKHRSPQGSQKCVPTGKSNCFVGDCRGSHKKSSAEECQNHGRLRQMLTVERSQGGYPGEEAHRAPCRCNRCPGEDAAHHQFPESTHGKVECSAQVRNAQ